MHVDLRLRQPLSSFYFPYTTLYRSEAPPTEFMSRAVRSPLPPTQRAVRPDPTIMSYPANRIYDPNEINRQVSKSRPWWVLDRKSTRLNSSHQIISYAVFCLKKKKKY